jgi:hypothetical protein
MAELGFVGDGPNSYQVRWQPATCNILSPSIKRWQLSTSTMLNPSCIQQGLPRAFAHCNLTFTYAIVIVIVSPASVGIQSLFSFCLQIWLGGNENQTRLAEVYAERVKVKDLDSFLEPLFAAFVSGRKTKAERFGDWAARVGLKAVKAAQEAAKAAAATAAPSSNGNGVPAEASSNGVAAPRAAAKAARVGAGSNGAGAATATLTKPAAVDTAALAALEAAAKAQGMTAAQYAAYLASQLSSGAPSQ